MAAIRVSPELAGELTRYPLFHSGFRVLPDWPKYAGSVAVRTGSTGAPMRYDLIDAGMASAPVRIVFVPEDMDAVKPRLVVAKTKRTGPANILLVCLDRTGLANSAAFGGPCPMPVLEQLTAAGRILPNTSGKARVSDRPVTEVLKAQGYSTARFGLCPEHDGNLRIGRCFDHVDAMVSQTLQFSARREPSPCHFTECMTSRAIDWLDQQTGKPFFLSWTPRLPCSARAVPCNWTAKHRHHFAGFDMAALGGFLDYVDYQLGRLVDHLECRGLIEDTLILVAGLEDTPAPPPLFMDILVENLISPVEAAWLVRAQIRLRGGAEAFLEKAVERGDRSTHIPHWAHDAGNHKPIAGNPALMHWPSGPDYEALAGYDITQLILTAAVLPKKPPRKPNLCVIYSFPVDSG
jgi:arylsulfatase A-like enzyme